MNRTLEQILKFDSGLSIGMTLVEFIGPLRKRALVEITSRGLVRTLIMPSEGTMCSGWYRVKGDVSKADGGVKVWPAKDVEWMARFEGEPKRVDLTAYIFAQDQQR